MVNERLGRALWCIALVVCCNNCAILAAAAEEDIMCIFRSFVVLLNENFSLHHCVMVYIHIFGIL